MQRPHHGLALRAKLISSLRGLPPPLVLPPPGPPRFCPLWMATSRGPLRPTRSRNAAAGLTGNHQHREIAPWCARLSRLSVLGCSRWRCSLTVSNPVSPTSYVFVRNEGSTRSQTSRRACFKRDSRRYPRIVKQLVKERLAGIAKYLPAGLLAMSLNFVVANARAIVRQYDAARTVAVFADPQRAHTGRTSASKCGLGSRIPG